MCIYYNKKNKTCKLFQRIMEHKTDYQPRYILAKDCVENKSLCGPDYKKFQEKSLINE
jgi:hypothetical protein